MPHPWLKLMTRFSMQLAWHTILRHHGSLLARLFIPKMVRQDLGKGSAKYSSARQLHSRVRYFAQRNRPSPNWWTVSLVVMVLEAVVGSMILLGLFTRVAATVGVLMSLGLTLTFCFCNCPWTNDFLLVFWFYFGPFLLNVQLIFDQSSESTGLQRILRSRKLRFES